MFTHLPAPLRVERQLQYVRSQARVVAGRRQAARHAVFDDLAHAADARRNHRNSRGHGFDHRQRDAFADAGEQEQIRGAQQPVDVVALAQKANLVRQLILFDQMANLVSLRSIADQHQPDARELPDHTLDRPYGGGVVSLPA